MRFSSCCTQNSPWLPPGLKISPLMIGVSILANVTDDHIITRAIPKNHFHKFTLYARNSFSPTRITNTGMRNAGKPKFTDIR